MKPIDLTPNFQYTGHDCVIEFAKMVEGGYIIATDVNFNIIILNERCEKLQILPYSRKVVDAVADKKNIFVAIEMCKVLVFSKKDLVMIEKINFPRYVHAICRNERNEVRVVGSDGMNYYVDLRTLAAKKSNFVCTPKDLRQNLHYTKHGTNCWIIGGPEMQVLTNYGEF